jgi:hypothetical protein
MNTIDETVFSKWYMVLNPGKVETPWKHIVPSKTGQYLQGLSADHEYHRVALFSEWYM